MRTRATAVLAAGCAVHVTCAACGVLVWLGLRMCVLHGVARARQLLHAIQERAVGESCRCGSRMRIYHACSCHIFDDNVNVRMCHVQCACVHVCAVNACAVCVCAAGTPRGPAVC